MCKNKKMAKAILRESFYKLKSLIKYTCEHLGISFVEVLKTFPSSKLCSYCGCKVIHLKKYHTFQFPNCKTELDRDFNAALNLKKEGFRILEQSLGFTVTPKDLSNLPFSCTLDERYCSICTVKERCSKLWCYQIPFYCSNYSTCDFSSCICRIGNEDYSTLCKKKQERLEAKLPFSCNYFSRNGLSIECSESCSYSSTCNRNLDSLKEKLPFSCSNYQYCINNNNYCIWRKWCSYCYPYYTPQSI